MLILIPNNKNEFVNMCRYKRSFLGTFMWHSMFKFEFEEIMEEIIEKIMEEIMDLMENIMKDRVMCLDGWEIYGTKERLVDDHYEFVTHPIV